MNKNNKLEKGIVRIASNIIITPYNYSILIMTLVIWVLTLWFPYNSGQNFDMSVFVSQNIIFFGLASIIIGVVCIQYKQITQLALVTNVITIMAIIFMKSYESFFRLFSIFILMPLSMFGFLLVVKNIFLVTMQNSENDPSK